MHNSCVPCQVRLVVFVSGKNVAEFAELLLLFVGSVPFFFLSFFLIENYKIILKKICILFYFILFIYYFYYDTIEYD